MHTLFVKDGSGTGPCAGLTASIAVIELAGLERKRLQH